MNDPIEIRSHPKPAVWGQWLARKPLGQTAFRFRQQLGLPTDRPVVLSGHQAAVWHPGILAKLLGASAAAAAFGAEPAWIVVDQDPEDFASVRVPVRTSAGRLEVRPWQMAPRAVTQQLAQGVPPCRIGLFQPTPVPADSQWPGAAGTALPGIASRLERIRAAIAAAAKNFELPGNAAMQLWRATLDLAAPLMATPAASVRTLTATGLHVTDLFVSIVGRMFQDAEQCVFWYNEAVAAYPEAGIAALGYDKAAKRFELPLWNIDAATSMRRRVFSGVNDGLRPQVLAPRALLLTAMVRMAACDVFIHGLGGGSTVLDETGRAAPGYDAVMERWIGNWLNEQLAPSVVMSATMRLPIQSEAPVEPSQVRHAKWLVHAMAHNPALAGDAQGAASKAAALLELKRAGADRRARLTVYKAMHESLAAWRSAHSRQIDEAQASAARLQALLADRQVLLDRTWAFPMYPPQQLQDLAQAVRSEFGLP